MKIDADALPSGSVRRADICVIGAGAAGITLAREFINSGKTVILLEGGALAWDEKSQDSYKPSMVTAEPKDLVDMDYPTWSRLRYFGGSTNHWGGWSRPFDECDFLERAWVPESGWPIRRSDLHFYYRKAASYIEIRPFDLQGEIGSGPVQTREFYYSPPTRFGEVYRDDLFNAPNVEVILNASAVRLNTDGGDNVTSVEVQNSNHDVLSVEANAFILACGGIENSRLLLNSDHQRAAGLGNSHDMVGRCFMEHPHATMGLLANTEDAEWHKAFTGVRGRNPLRIFVTSQEFHEKHRTLNFSCELQRRSDGPGDEAEPLKLSKFLYGKDTPVNFLSLYTRSEMAPSKSNRISLSRDRDAFGIRRSEITLRYSADDLKSVVKSTEGIIGHLSAKMLGRGKITIVDDLKWSDDVGVGCHHMGGTRMSADPRDGVVDRNCKVHDVNNLYVAGSSLFATSSYANPTLTLVALAIRLADHLKGMS